MTKRISTYLSVPHFEDSLQQNRAKVLNGMLLIVIGCCIACLVVTALKGDFPQTIDCAMLAILGLMSNIILHQKQLRLASFLFLGSLSFFNVLTGLLMPDLPILSISLAFVCVLSLLLVELHWAFLIYGINVIGIVLLTLPVWSGDLSQLFPLLWVSLAVFWIMVMLRLYLKSEFTLQKELEKRCDRFAEENAQLQSALTDMQGQLDRELETRKSLEMQIQDEVEHDPSHRFNPQTGIYTEKAILDLIGQEISRTRRYQRPLSLLCIRVDNIIGVVEKAGLTPGKLLSMLSDTFNESLRREDALGHFDLDGFYILLPETGRYASYVVAERLRHLVEVMSLFNAEENTNLTISIGLTAYQDQGKMSVELFTTQSKEALASAEEHGGNWTISWYDLNHTPA